LKVFLVQVHYYSQNKMLLPEIGKNSFVSLEISASTTTGCDNVVTH